MSDWTKGYPIDKLRALAYPFKVRHEPLVFGAFGMVKERDVADALASKRFVFVGADVEAAAIFKRVAPHNNTTTDFTGEPLGLFPKRFYVSAITGFSTMATVHLLDLLKDEAAGVPTYVEIFEEDGIAKSAMIFARYRYRATKISAGGEVKGVYSAPWTWPADVRVYDPEEEATLLVLDKEFITPLEQQTILDEVERSSQWEQHYSSYNKRKSWTSFALRGYQDDPSFIIKPAEMSKAWKEANAEVLKNKPRDTTIAHLFPATLQVVARIAPHSALDRVRFMRLAEKKGELTRHADITDRRAGVADGKISRLHLPIKTNPIVEFCGWDHRGGKITKHLPERTLCYLDQRKPHAVTNSSPDERIHLVVDMCSNEVLREKIRAQMDGVK